MRLGKPFNGLIVATFSDDQNPAANTLAATIDWGDGSSSGGNVQSDGSGGYIVTGDHTYKTPPEHPAIVTISDTPHSYSAIVTDTVRMWPKTESH